MSKYEVFAMVLNESINDCFARFVAVLNDLRSLEKVFNDEDFVRKFL